MLIKMLLRDLAQRELMQRKELQEQLLLKDLKELKDLRQEKLSQEKMSRAALVQRPLRKMSPQMKQSLPLQGIHPGRRLRKTPQLPLPQPLQQLRG